MSCKDCELYFLKSTKDRPLCCHRCELHRLWHELIPNLPGYNLLIKVCDWLNGALGLIEKFIKTKNKSFK